MYEYRRTPGGLGALGTNGEGRDGADLLRDVQTGVLSRGQARDVCFNLAPDRIGTDFTECRRLFTAAEACRVDSGGAPCSNFEVATYCNVMSPPNIPGDCDYYLTFAEALSPEEMNRLPAPTAEEIVEAEGLLTRFAENVAAAGRRIARTVLPPDPQVEAVQNAVIAAGCTLPRYGVDGRWGDETEAGVRCLAARQSWQQVVQQFPTVAQRMTVPSGPPPVTTTPTTFPTGVATVVKPSFSPLPVPPSVAQQPPRVQTASMGPSIPTTGLPSWVPWAAAGFGLLGIIVLGAYMTRKKEEEFEFEEERYGRF